MINLIIFMYVCSTFQIKKKINHEKSLLVDFFFRSTVCWVVGGASGEHQPIGAQGLRSLASARSLTWPKRTLRPLQIASSVTRTLRPRQITRSLTCDPLIKLWYYENYSNAKKNTIMQLRILIVRSISDRNLIKGNAGCLTLYNFDQIFREFHFSHETMRFICGICSLLGENSRFGKKGQIE